MNNGINYQPQLVNRISAINSSTGKSLKIDPYILASTLIFPKLVPLNDPIAMLVYQSIYNHQEFQVPKMEVLNLIRLFWG